MDQSEVLKFERQKITRLSDAIRVGAKLRRQCLNQLSDGIGTCALGAAIEGIWGKGSIFTDGGNRSCEDLDKLFGTTWRSLEIAEHNDAGKSREWIANLIAEVGY